MTRSAEYALLKSLSDVGNYSTPKRTLFAEVNLRLPPNLVMTHADFDALLLNGQEKKRVICITGEDDVRVKITDEGRLRLAELGG